MRPSRGLSSWNSIYGRTLPLPYILESEYGLEFKGLGPLNHIPYIIYVYVYICREGCISRIEGWPTSTASFMVRTWILHHARTPEFQAPRAAVTHVTIGGAVADEDLVPCRQVRRLNNWGGRSCFVRKIPCIVGLTVGILCLRKPPPK